MSASSTDLLQCLHVLYRKTERKGIAEKGITMPQIMFLYVSISLPILRFPF